MGYDFSFKDTAEKIRSVLKKNTDKVFVAAADERVVGYMHANDYDLLYFPHMKNIMGIAVASKYKKKEIKQAEHDLFAERLTQAARA